MSLKKEESNWKRKVKIIKKIVNKFYTEDNERISKKVLAQNLK